MKPVLGPSWRSVVVTGVMVHTHAPDVKMLAFCKECNTSGSDKSVDAISSGGGQSRRARQMQTGDRAACQRTTGRRSEEKRRVIRATQPPIIKGPAAVTGSRVEAAFALNASVQPKTLLLDGKPAERRENLQLSLFVLWGNGPVT